MILALDHIQFAMPAGGEAAARDFFGRVLGMREEEKPEPLAARGGCWFRSGPVLLHLGVEKEFRPQRKGHPAFRIHDLDALATRFKEEGIQVQWDDAIPSRRRFYASDPFGNRLEFMQDGDGFGQR